MESKRSSQSFILSGKTRLSQALTNIPDALEYIVSLNPHDFTRLHNPFMRKYMSPRISLQRVAAMAEIPIEQLLQGLAALEPKSEIDKITVEVDSPEVVVPLSQTPQNKPGWMRGIRAADLHRVDVLPIDDILGDPFPPISLGFKWMQPGEVILLLHRWEPQPLYDIWQKMKLEWFTKQISAHEWHIYIHKPDSFPMPSPPAEIAVEVRHLSKQEIAPRIVALFEQLFEGQRMRITGFSVEDQKLILDTMQENFAGKYEDQPADETNEKPVIYLRAKTTRPRAASAQQFSP